jgi:hypothetical protein
MAATQAKATVNQAGNLLWTADLPGVATDASVTPVVFSTSATSGYHSGFSWTYSGATFSGDSSTGAGGVVQTGMAVGSYSPAVGVAATTNYIRSYAGGSILMTMPGPESYLGFLAQNWASQNFNEVILINGAGVVGYVTAAQIDSAAGTNGYAWINIDVANGGTYTKALFSLAQNSVGLLFDISYGTTSESLTSLTNAAPVPALAGTLPGFASAVLGMLGFRRRAARRA